MTKETTENEGTKAFQEVGRKLVAEVKANKLAAAQAAVMAANLSPAALEYMNRHATTGAEDLNTGVSVPQLRIHSAGVSSKNVLADGSDPKDGQIFYTGDQSAADKMTVILLAIKKCRLEQVDDEGKLVVDAQNKPILKAHYLLAGVLNDTMQPFVIYVKGMSYNKIWDLEEQLKPYVTKREGGIPLSMVKIVVSSQKEVVEQGKYKGQKKNVFKFELLMHESGEFPILEGDGEKLDMLELSTEKSEMMLDQIIKGKGLSEVEFNQQKKDAEFATRVQETVVDGEVVKNAEPDSEFPWEKPTTDDDNPL